MKVYSLNQLVKKYDDRTVLNIDSLTIEKGYIYALLGPNGSGKTTLLNILAFLDQPTSGQLLFQDLVVKFQERTLHSLRQKVVMVHQNPILFSTTVFKNLEFGLKIRKIAKTTRRRIIEESLEMVGLRHLEKALAHKLSGGETQRVVLARALALSPEIILCDEPTASVDLENQIKIGQLLKDINQEKGITLVFTSHDQKQAESLPHRSVYLERGKISQHAYENIFPLQVIQRNTSLLKHLAATTQNHSLFSPKNQGKRVHIDPRSIHLSPITKNNLNGLATVGTVTRLSGENDAIQLVVNCNIAITIIISRSDYQSLQPMIGDVLQLQIPASAYSVLN